MKLLILFAALAVAFASPTCRDRRPDCELFEELCNIDGPFKQYMEYFCPKTCGFCSGTAKPTPAPKPLPPHVGGCGAPDIQATRVIAGKTPVRGSWPWQILLMFMRQPMCGGTLISPNWVVTAAHCVFQRDQYPTAFTVRVGEHDMRVFEGSERDVIVEKIIINRGWDPRMLNNDIALLKLSEPVQFNKYVSPICLPSQDAPVGAKCVLTGWGKIQHPGGMTPLLQQGELPVVSNQVCYNHNKNTIPVPITKAMICGGSGGSSRLSGCHGDSGGPYVCEINGRWELHGSVSHGSPVCESTQTYTVFSRTFYFKPWILKQMAEN